MIFSETPLHNPSFHYVNKRMMLSSCGVRTFNSWSRQQSFREHKKLSSPTRCLICSLQHLLRIAIRVEKSELFRPWLQEVYELKLGYEWHRPRGVKVVDRYHFLRPSRFCSHSVESVQVQEIQGRRVQVDCGALHGTSLVWFACDTVYIDCMCKVSFRSEKVCPPSSHCRSYVSYSTNSHTEQQRLGSILCPHLLHICASFEDEWQRLRRIWFWGDSYGGHSGQWSPLIAGLDGNVPLILYEHHHTEGLSSSCAAFIGRITELFKFEISPPSLEALEGDRFREFDELPEHDASGGAGNSSVLGRVASLSQNKRVKWRSREEGWKEGVGDE